MKTDRGSFRPVRARCCAPRASAAAQVRDFCSREVVTAKPLASRNRLANALRRAGEREAAERRPPDIV